MRDQQLIGLVVIAAILVTGILAAAWIEYRKDKGRRQERTERLREPAPGSFTAAVLNAEQAARDYREAVLQGDHIALLRSFTRIGDTFLPLSRALRERAAAGPYATGPRSVTVTESDRLAGEPHTTPGDNHEDRKLAGPG